MAVVTFQREAMATAYPDAAPLMQAHWEEVGRDRDLLVLNPDVEKMVSLEAAGMWHVWTARADGDLVGYAAWIVAPHLHYRDAVTAFCDVIYMSPGSRRHALSFIRHVEADLQTLGAAKAFFHVKVTKDFGPLLERLGYEWSEKLYERRLA